MPPHNALRITKSDEAIKGIETRRKPDKLKAHARPGTIEWGKLTGSFGDIQEDPIRPSSGASAGLRAGKPIFEAGKPWYYRLG
ncbi:MAG: hypothetical protein B9J98_03105 [Candidatus Terraquivivens tikiterensis]|uniref:Uncharacterized protein n=1 Tax=Candidatus Terraquivivens tikiterensis TaxID=1980982 RepID=A0A2R7Y5Z4_9ARCH|nr:MAG: hypothetical protein B9J98_03105 [Candidatus Terraquivivens tikiterensis]